MKKIVLASTVALALVSGQAMAVCSGNSRLNQTQLSTVLGNKTVCVGSAPTWTAQEFHSGATSGSLIDYKRGPGHAVDPSATVGSWAIAGSGNNATVTYSYTGGSTYSWEVFDNGGGAFSFCSGGSSGAEATIKQGQVSC